MKACDDLRAALVGLVMGEVDDETEARLNEHLLSCPPCRDEERRLLALRNELRGGEVKPSAELRARIRTALPRRPARGAFVYLGRPVPAYVALAAALAGALFVLILPGADRARMARAPLTARSVRAVSGTDHALFSVAGPYETGVRPAGRREGSADSSSSDRPQSRDSL